MSEYSLDELQKLAGPALPYPELVELANSQSPKRTYELALSRWPRRQAKAARFLAILRRDHGQGAIQALISSVEYARPQGTEHAQEGDNMTTPTLSQPQFLYPTSRQFPFDVICEAIVRELEARNWQAPGITVEFHEYGTGETKFRRVSVIKSQDFKLWFCRKQGSLVDGRLNDTSAVTEIVIPKKELSIHEDESGPTLYTYVGNNWARDREKFIYGRKVSSKLYKEPRSYLMYRGNGYRNRRSSTLSHYNDLGREYELGRKWNWTTWNFDYDPQSFQTAEVFEEFTLYLEKTVLRMILSHPVPTEKVDRLTPQPVPFPKLSILGDIFCFGDEEDAERIKEGQADPSQLSPSDRYGMLGTGYRLVNWGIKNDGTLPKIAYEGFLWCGIHSGLVLLPLDSLEVPGHYHSSIRGGKYVILVKPNRANDIYIADHGAYENRREELKAGLEPDRDRFTDEEVADFTRARGRTIIPVAEYNGGFEQPVILIARELGFDEVEVIAGPYRSKE